MDAFEYRFTSKTGDIYIVRILNDGARFLSSEIISALEKSDVEVWGIYLNRVGSYKHVTGIRDLSLISNQIYSFFATNDLDELMKSLALTDSKSPLARMAVPI